MEHASVGCAFAHCRLDAPLGTGGVEYVPGVTLDVLLRRGPLEWNEVARLGAQLARGLAAAHATGVVHRDIKPANLRVTPEGLLKILDFGIAPFAANGREGQDPRADIFSAGAVLYEMACGRAPFTDTHPVRLIEAILNGDVPLPSQVHPQLHPALERIIIRALEPQPARRFRSAADLADALEALLVTTPSPTSSFSSLMRWAGRMMLMVP